MTTYTLIVNQSDTGKASDSRFYRVPDELVTPADLDYLHWGARGFAHNETPASYPKEKGNEDGFVELQLKAEQLPQFSTVFEHVSRVYVLHDNCF